MSQPLYFSQLARLLVELGDQEPMIGQFERSITPTLAIGDAREVVPPLYGPTSYGGGFAVGAGAGSSPGVAIRSRSPGGSLLTLTASGLTTTVLTSRIVAVPVIVTNPIILQQIDVVAGGASYSSIVGEMDEALFGNDIPVQTTTNAYRQDWVIPNGESFEAVLGQVSGVIFVSFKIRDLVARSAL